MVKHHVLWPELDLSNSGRLEDSFIELYWSRDVLGRAASCRIRYFGVRYIAQFKGRKECACGGSLYNIPKLIVSKCNIY